jgi:multicomponent Na+:H+ antiporter subunit E
MQACNRGNRGFFGRASATVRQATRDKAHFAFLQRTRPVHQSASATGSFGRALVWRVAASLGLWLVLIGGPDPADRPAGLLAVLAATWVSLRLLPPRAWRVAPTALVSLVLRFLHQSIVGGCDVAWRALDPRWRLRPGLLVYPTRFSSGPALTALSTLASLAPGTLATGPNASGAMVIHCLDVDQPVAAVLAADERLLADALGTNA